MGWWQKTKNAIKWAFSKPVKPKKSVKTDEYEVVRSRNKKGQYVGDDKSTPDVNEAYTRRKKKKK
jgi:hypothetical protein